MKKLELKKKLVVNLSDYESNQIRGGTVVTDYYCDLGTVNPCLNATTPYGGCPNPTYTGNYYHGTNAYDTNCCSADLEICNTNSDPYCSAC